MVFKRYAPFLSRKIKGSTFSWNLSPCFHAVLSSVNSAPTRMSVTMTSPLEALP